MGDHLPINVADGHITECRLAGDKLTVSITDWQEKPLALCFVGVAAILTTSPTDVELSHIERSADDPMLLNARGLGEEKKQWTHRFSIRLGMGKYIRANRNS